MQAPLAGYKTYIASALAVLGALGGALDGDISWAQASAIITPAVIGAALRHGLSTSVTGLISAVVDALAKAADQIGQKKGAPLFAIIIGGTLLLWACSTPATNDSGKTAEAGSLAFAYEVACGAYSQAKAPLAVAEQLGAFDAKGQTALAESMAGADQLCSSPTAPQDLNAAIARVNQVAAAVLIAVAQAHGKLPSVPAKS